MNISFFVVIRPPYVYVVYTWILQKAGYKTRQNKLLRLSLAERLAESLAESFAFSLTQSR